MVARAGFLVQNAPDVGANLDIAEPDALDFNLLGNHCYGVLSGCVVTVTGSSFVVNISTGVYVVNGQIASGGGQFTPPGASQDARFDLIVGDASGHLSALIGTANPNPVFPTYDDTVTVFASIMVRPGATVLLPGDVTDKRIMLMQRFTTALTGGSLLHSANPADLSTRFDIDYNGKQTWDGDGTALSRIGVKQLRVNDNLDVVGTLSAAAVTTAGDLNVNGDIIGTNFRQGAGPPSGTATLGDIYKNLTDGAIWAYQVPGVWNQLSTVPIPAGMTMMGFMTAPPPGWLLVGGQQVTQAQAGGLWNAFPSWRMPDGQHLQLPNAQGCFFAWGTPGTVGGNLTGQVTLTTDNLPSHRHLTSPSGQMNPAGSHAHPGSTMTPAGGHVHLTVAGQGVHVHALYDPGHHHPVPPGTNGFLALQPGAPSGYALGPQPIVGSLNTGENLDQFGHGTTAITVLPTNSEHQHSTDNPGDHAHVLSIPANGSDHVHVINEVAVGNNVPIDIRPPFMGMFLFIKT